MNFQQLEYVVEVSRYSSINKASQALFITQPALSSAIKELETEIGFTIFQRSKSGITPTAEGLEFIRSAETILSQVEHMRSLYSGASKENAPAVLKISCARYSFISKALVNFYNDEFTDRNRFSVYLRQNHCSDVVEDVYFRRSELGIIHIRNVEEPQWKKNLAARGLEYQYLFSLPSGAVFRKGHPLESKKDITMDDIMQYPQLHIASQGGEYSHYDMTPGFVFPEDMEKNIYTNSRCLVYDFLSETDAVFLSTNTLFLEEFHDRLTAVPLPDEQSKWNIFAVHLKGANINPYTIKFLETVKRTVEGEIQNSSK